MKSLNIIAAFLFLVTETHGRTDGDYGYSPSMRQRVVSFVDKFSSNYGACVVNSNPSGTTVGTAIPGNATSVPAAPAAPNMPTVSGTPPGVPPTTASPVTLPKSINWDEPHCGPKGNNGNCEELLGPGTCCSGFGFCSKSEEHCTSCIPKFGFCPEAEPPSPGTTPTTASVSEKDQTRVWSEGTDDSKPLQPGIYISNCKVPNTVALTFDDGPGSYTAQLLDTLKNANVKATFFTVGANVDGEFGGFLTRIDQEGHQVACHTYMHDPLWPNKYPHKSDNANWLTQEMQRSTEAIAKRIKKKPKYFRPPYGNMNEQLVEYLKVNGMIAVHWSLDSNDWKPEVKANPALIIDAVKGISGTANVLMHEIHETTVKAVPDVIAFLKSNANLKFVTVAECMGDNNAYLQ